MKDGYVPIQVERLTTQGAMKEISWETKDRTCAIQFANGLILNGQNQDLQVGYLEYMEVDTNTAKVIYFNSWITDLPITEDNALEMVR